ncbi:hypothetical protein CAB1_0611 [Chlamydia abortus LLG]|nr:hypothetical protein [Chlamydia abortus]EGK69340.1 hypothetical protein CAB1_0611 [Chlamydia abortus LLG]
MASSIEGNSVPTRLSVSSIRSRCSDLVMVMNQRALVVPRCRVVLELAAAIIGTGCLALSIASLTGLVALSSSIWLVPTGCVLGAALLTFAITSVFLRQGELRREREWRSLTMRWYHLVSDLNRQYPLGHTARHS